MLTYAQNFEDVVLARAFEGRSTGFYIDIGASHPEHLSVTKHFYERGWRGVNVEPIPRAYQRFLAARPRDVNLNVAVGRARGEREFFECSDFDALSTFDPVQAEFLRKQGHTIVSYPVPTITCDDVFERAGGVEVDFLKIDVEGAEQEVIESLDLARHRPKIILLESMAPGRAFPGWHDLESVENWSAWEPRILAGGYRFAHFDGVSRFYVRDDVAELAKVFRLPVGMFDDVHFPEEFRLQRREAELLGHVSGLERHAASLEKHVKKEFARTRKLEKDLEEARAATVTPELVRLESELAEAKAALKAHKEMPWWPAVKFAAYRFKVTVRDAIFGAVWTFARGRGARPLPPITIVTPVMNAAARIAETLESVLYQDYPSLQYIVVDGGSTDGTLEIIEHYAARTDLPQRIAAVLKGPDAGRSDALAKGFEHAVGEVLACIDGDELLEAGALQAVGRHFADHRRANAVFHDDSVMVNGWKFPNARVPARLTVDDLLQGRHPARVGAFFRKELFRLAGGVRRELPLAGDYDLWLRMCALGRFDRRPGHVRCVHQRDLRPSAGTEAYRAEVARAKADFLRGKGLLRRAYWKAVGIVARAAGRLADTPGRFDYAGDGGREAPPDAIVPPQPGAAAPRSAIDGRCANRLLFTTPDTRFGGRELNYVYFDDRHGTSMSYPPIEPDRLDALYRKNYSAPPTEVGLPKGVSPYRAFDRRRPWHRIAFTAGAESLGGLGPLPGFDDNTLEELTRVLREAAVDPGRELRFLDAGCFDGALLDRVKAERAWQCFGLEPNLHAVAIARGKGHEVWAVHAEDALEVVPRDRAFDVIFMGQTIEHMDDPLQVLRRLRLLLAPGGVLVCSTPSLDSRLLEWFGPTWTHWHAPYHRHLFTVRGFRALAAAAGLHVRTIRTVSHPYWTAMTLAQNALGVEGVVSHDVKFDEAARLAAQRYTAWARRWWDRRGEGDCLFAVMAEDERG